MAFDAYFLTAVLSELRSEATGSRVEKIHQPARDSVIFLLRTERGRQKLLLAANPNGKARLSTSLSSKGRGSTFYPFVLRFPRPHLAGHGLLA